MHRTREEETSALVRTRLESLRRRLLDLSRRNPLISTRFSNRSNAYVRVVDELPDRLLFTLRDRNHMALAPLPSLDEDPKDEETRCAPGPVVGSAADRPRSIWTPSTPSTRTAAMVSNGPAMPNGSCGTGFATNWACRRARPGTTRPWRSMRGTISSRRPTSCLFRPTATTTAVTTTTASRPCCFPDTLDRTMTRLLTKFRTWEQETGINVFHAAFGFLEWGTSRRPSSRHWFFSR